jgi:hypothetical protein
MQLFYRGVRSYQVNVRRLLFFTHLNDINSTPKACGFKSLSVYIRVSSTRWHVNCLVHIVSPRHNICMVNPPVKYYKK